MSGFKDPTTYAGEFVCARCGSGWPCCADTKPDGTQYTHEETCAKYETRDDWEDMGVCDKCEKMLAREPLGDPE